MRCFQLCATSGKVSWFVLIWICSIIWYVSMQKFHFNTKRILMEALKPKLLAKRRFLLLLYSCDGFDEHDSHCNSATDFYQGRAHSSTLLRDNDMLRKWEEVTTTDTFTMYYASVFRGRSVLPRDPKCPILLVHPRLICIDVLIFELQAHYRYWKRNCTSNSSICHPWSISDLCRYCER